VALLRGGRGTVRGWRALNGTERYDLEPAQLLHACRELLAAGGRMQMAYAWFPEPGVPEVRYLGERGPHRPFLMWRSCPPAGSLASLAQVSPLLGWYEREMTDLCGLQFEGHPEPIPLVLHEGVQATLPPLDPRYPAQEPVSFEPAAWQLPEVHGRDVQLLPFGPVRADVVESAQMLFFYIGEGILHFHPRLFFKHRGMERSFEGRAPEHAMVVAERVSGVGSVAHALAYCQAVEAAAGCTVPARARWLRALLAELERVYNHLHYLGHLCHTTTLKVGEAEGKLLEERAKQINGRLTGSRLLRGLLVPGGLRRDLDTDTLDGPVAALEREVARYTARLERTNSHLDRLMTTGVLGRELARDQGATGPVERASGLGRDLRCDHPYAAYDELPPDVAVRAGGDAYARMQVRIAEMAASLSWIRRAGASMPAGIVRAPWRLRPGAEGLGWSESPRGALYYAVHLDDRGRLARVKVKSPSFSNWRVFPFTVHDTNMMDYAINEASFGLTIAGCDR
jgi:formate hydrogenlyase subunit 5